MKPIRILKAVFLIKIATLSALLLIVLALSLFVLLFPKTKIESIINLRAENLLQRRINIGSINYSFRGVKLTDVAILEPGTDVSFITADTIEITFALAPIFRRELELQDLYIDSLAVNVDYADGAFNLEDLITTVSTSLSQSDSPQNFRTTLPSFHLTNAQIDVKNSGEDREPLNGLYSIDTDIFIYDDNSVDFNNLSLTLPKTRGTLSGGLRLSFPEDSFEITGDLDLKDIDIRWVYYFKDDKPADLPYYLINGHVRGLKITKDFVEGTVEQTNCVLTNGVVIKLKSGFTRVATSTDEFVILDAQATANRSSFELRKLDIYFDKHVIFDASMETTDINDIKSMIPPIEDAPLSGIVSGNLSYDNRYYNGTLEISSGAYAPYISNVNESVTIRNNTFSKEKIKVSIYNEEALISVASLSKDFNKFAFNADFNKLVLGDSPDEKPFFPDSNLKEHITGVITTGSLSYKKLHLGKTYFAYTYSNKGIVIPRFKTEFENSDITGKVDILTSNSSENPVVKTRLNVSRLQIQRLSPYVEKLENRFYGIASGNADISFIPGGNFSDTLSGSMNIKIENGKLLNTGIQNSLGIILRPLQYKLSDLEFQEIYGNVNFTNGGYRVNSLMFNSPNIRMSVNGTINRANMGNLDITLLFNNIFIQDIPNFAYPQFQRYRQGEWYILPFQIRNKNILENPQAELIN